MSRNIIGSHGEFEINEEGLPVGEIPEEYKKYVRFDLKEYDEWCQKNGNPKKLENIDIMSIGLWYVEDEVEKYDPADDGWRKVEIQGWPTIIDNGTVAELVGGQ